MDGDDQEVGTTDAPAQDETTQEDVPSADIVSVEEAMAMFIERPDLSAVLTDKGFLRRDGTFAQ